VIAAKDVQAVVLRLVDVLDAHGIEYLVMGGGAVVESIVQPLLFALRPAGRASTRAANTPPDRASL
jgi:hypothetical protein